MDTDKKRQSYHTLVDPPFRLQFPPCFRWDWSGPLLRNLVLSDVHSQSVSFTSVTLAHSRADAGVLLGVRIGVQRRVNHLDEEI